MNVIFMWVLIHQSCISYMTVYKASMAAFILYDMQSCSWCQRVWGGFTDIEM